MQKASFNAFLLTIALGILAFLPPTFVPFTTLKTVIIAVGLLVSIVLYVISRFQTKSAEFPKHPIILVGGLLGLSVIASCIFSASPANSFIGTNFDQYSGAFILIVLAAGLLTILLAKTRKAVISIVATILGAFSLVAIFQIFRLLFGGNILSLGTFTALTSTMVGSWYDLAILAALIFLISFFSIEFFYAESMAVPKRLKIIAIVLAVVSFLFLVCIGLSLAWIGIAIALLLFIMYRFISIKSVETSSARRIPYLAILVFLVAALFVWKGGDISGPIIQRLNIGYTEVSLPWSMTRDIADATFKQSPILGAGPDRFPEQYLLYKPAVVNTTQFWNVIFPASSSFIMTSFVDQGILGGILWLVLFAWFVVLGVRAMMRLPETAVARSLVVIPFITAFFLWIMLFIYAPSHVIIFLTMIMTGLSIANIPKIKMVAVHVASGTAGESDGWKNHKSVFAALCIVLICALAGIFISVKDAIAQTYYQAGLNAAAAGNVDSARSSFQNALSFDKSDVYYQSLAKIDAYQINSIISTATAASTTAPATIGSLINDGIGAARSGQVIDPANVNNYLAEGDLSEIAAALNVPNGYLDSKISYAKAAGLSPLDPSIYLSAGRLEYVEGSTTAAEADINAALSLKPDYTDALFEAGIISYNSGDYKTAVAAFQAVLKIDNTYVNAEYFLGLTLARAGDPTDAVTVFTDLVKAYPNNTTIKNILADLQAGRSIFADSQGAPPQPEAQSSSTEATTVTSTVTPAPKVPALSGKVGRTPKGRTASTTIK